MKACSIFIPSAAAYDLGCWQSAMSEKAPSGRCWNIGIRTDEFRNLFQFCEEVDSRSLNKRVLESLVKSGALDSLGWKRSQCMAMIDAAIEHGQKARRDRESGQKGLFCHYVAGQPPSPNRSLRIFRNGRWNNAWHSKRKPWDSMFPGIRSIVSQKEISRFSKKTIAELIGEGKTAECKVAGIITDFRTRRTKKGDLMAVFTLEDLTGSVETVVFPGSYQSLNPT